jgi:beta-galactosidase
MTFKKHRIDLLILVLAGICFMSQHALSQRIIQLQDANWKFINKEVTNGEQPELNTGSWQTVDVPHDLAISGKFSEDIDLQVVKVVEDGESVAKRRSGRTGGLPHIGIGWYRKTLEIPASGKGKRIFAEFDGAMSHARVYLNGKFAGEWPYGYASFGFELTDQINFGGKNTMAVRLENKPNSSRWFPGAGIYRNVRFVATSPGLEKTEIAIKIDK